MRIGMILDPDRDEDAQIAKLLEESRRDRQFQAIHDILQQENSSLEKITGATSEAPAKPEAPAIQTRSREEMRQIEAFEDQYMIQAADLLKTGQSNEDIPGRIQVVMSLTPEVLAMASRIRNKFGGESRGLLVGDNDRHDKVRAINSHRMIAVQAHETYFYDSDNKDLWNGGDPWPEKQQWEYVITDGQTIIPDDPNIRGLNYQKASAWVEKYALEGLDVFTGADSYLALQRDAISRDQRIDPRSFTVLNAKGLTNSSALGLGSWAGGQIRLSPVAPDLENALLRVRPVIKVPLFRSF